MNALPLHIEYLLRTHDCVIIPRLGAFIINRRPAHFDREAGVITPPAAELTFNPSVTHNDGLLATSIARRAGIDYNSAVDILNEEVAGLRAELSSRRSTAIGSLGTLTLGPEENIIFSPGAHHAGLTDALGLPRLIMPRRFPEAPTPEVAAEATENLKPKHKRCFRPDKYYYIPVHKVFAKVAAFLALVVLIAAGIYSYTPAGQPDAPRRDCASVIPVAIEQPAPKPVAEVKVDTAAQFHVVVGTFTSTDEAARFMARHASDGYDLQAVHGKKYTRITADRSTDRQAMVAVLRSAHLDSCFNNAWIWEN